MRRRGTRNRTYPVIWSGLVGASAGVVLGNLITWVPNIWVIQGTDITWLVRIAQVALIGTALGAVVELGATLLARQLR